MKYTWAVTLFCAAVPCASSALAAVRPTPLPTRSLLEDPEPSTADTPAGWVTIDEFRGVPVVEYRKLHPTTGRIVVIGTRTAEGAAHGPEWSYWPNGASRIHRVWENDLLQGAYKAWFKSGMPRLDGTLKNDDRHGTWRRFAEKGHLAALSEYVDGLPHGTFREFYGSGADKSEQHFEAGVQTGVDRRWNPKGVLEFEANWLAGKQHGPWKLMARAGGPPGSQGFYSHGKRDGIWIEVTRKGVTISEVPYIDGMMEGVRKTWRDDGSLATEAYQEHGKETGPFSAWHVNGQKQMTGRKVDGKREGAWTFWRTDGSIEPAFTGTYANDVKVAD